MSNLEGRKVRGYTLDMAIGSGGFGTVYHAIQDVLTREVAVKVINEKYVNKPQFIRQFESEARIIARLEHFHIVPLFDYWRDPSGAYLVMRWLRGGSLRSYLKHNKLSIPQIVRLLNQISAALHFAHQQNVIHRDIKPENILLDDQGNAYLTDFGIAIDLRDRDNLDVDSISFGSPDYVAPEQLTPNQPITPSSDIYSLGIMLYELLAHARPFRGKDPKEILQMQLNNPVPSLRMTRKDLPTEIDTVIWQATAKRPVQRYDNVLELAYAFQSIATGFTEIPPNYMLGNARNIRPEETTSRFNTENLPTENLVTGTLMTENLETGVIEAVDTRAFSDTQEVKTADVDTGAVRTMEIIGDGPPNPYKGLRPFEETDAASFFGREEMVEELLTRFEDPSKRFLALVGPSGSGKSSLVRAGLIPALRKGRVGRSREWFISTMVPGDDAFRELSEALLRVAITAPENWGMMLRNNVHGLHNLLQLILPDDDSELLLFIDQFEEVFTLSEDEERREQFLGSLWYALNQPDTRLRVMITLRADFYDRPLHYAQFGELIKDNMESVLPLNIQELEAAIIKPAQQVNLTIDPTLTSAVLEDVHQQPGALPLLQYALTEMYERREGNRLGYEDYLAIGGITGALAKRAHEIYYNRLNDHEQALARQLFLRLVSIDDNDTVTRRRMIWSDVMADIATPEMLETVINAFSQHRLLTTDRDPVTRSPTVEIAHEALIKAWQQLRQWIDQNRSALQKSQELRQEVDRWMSNAQDVSYLAKGARLIEFESLLDNTLIPMRQLDRDYIKTSIAAREAERRRERILNMTLASLLVVALVAFVIAVIFGLQANNARSDAVEAAEIARSRELAASSIANQDQNDLALLLSVAASETETTYEAQNSLLLALQQHPFLGAYLPGHTGRVRDVTFDSSGTRGASVGTEGNLLRWNLATLAIDGEAIAAHENGANAVAYAPDDSVIATGGSDGLVKLWDADSGAAIRTLTGFDARVWDLSFSPDGTRLAATGDGNRILVWDVGSGEAVLTIENIHRDTAYTLAYTPDGTRLISGGDDNTIKLWDAASGEASGAPLSGHSNWVRSVTVLPNGQTLVSSDQDNTLIFWDLTSGEALSNPLPTGHAGWVYDVQFSPDGQVFATAGADGDIRLWNLNLDTGNITPLPDGVLSAHRGAVWNVAFHPTRFAMLSASEDGNVMLWELDRVQRPGDLLLQTDIAINLFALHAGTARYAISGERTDEEFSRIQIYSARNHSQQHNIAVLEEDGRGSVVTDIAFSPNGNLLAAALGSGAIHVYEVSSGQLRWQASEHDGIASAVTFTPDGIRLISADETGTVRVWDVAEATVIGSALYAPETGLTSLAISPNGRYLAMGGRDATILLWDLETETPVGEPLTGHDAAVEALLFDSESQRLVSGSRDNTIIIRELTTGNITQILEGQQDWVISLALSPDGRVLISGDREGGVRLWDFASGRPIGTTISGPDGWVTGLGFLDETSVIASNRELRLILGWTIDLDVWTELACTISNRELTGDEWGSYFPDEPYRTLCTAEAP